MKYLVCLLCLLLCQPCFAEEHEEKANPTESEKKVDKKKKKEEEMLPKKHTKEGLSGLREEALRQAAREYGFQKGFFDAYSKIQKACESRSRELDQMYPFEQVLLENGTVEPPVIVKADEYSVVANPETLVRTGTAYRIVRSAQFVSVPPSWRTYLILEDDAIQPQEVASQILPKTNAERKAWKEEYTKAYDRGTTDANEFFQEEMARLNREFMGMIEYHILHRQGKISLPNISRGHYDVRISDDTMEIDQRTFIITDKPHFQDKKKWRSLGR